MDLTCDLLYRMTGNSDTKEASASDHWSNKQGSGTVITDLFNV